MKTKNAIFIWVGAAVLIIAAAVMLLYSITSSNNNIAKMGKYNLKVVDYKYYLFSNVNQIESSYNLTSATVADKISFWAQQTADGITYGDLYKNNALDQLKRVTISALKAREEGDVIPQATKDEYTAYFQNLIDTNFAGNRVDADKAAVAELGVNIAQFTNILYEQYLAAQYENKYFTDGLARVLPTITTEDARVSYDADPTSYNTYTVTHILFLAVDPTTGAALDSTAVSTASTNASDVLAKVQAGGDMAALAAQYSQDDSTKDSGGVLAFNRLSTETDKALIDFATTSEIGKVSIIQSSSGYHVIRMDKNETTVFETITDDIRNEIATNKVNEEMTAFASDAQYATKINTKVLAKISVIR